MNIKKYLKNLEIDFKTFKHPAVYTCEQADKYCKNIKMRCKNLFLCNRKKTRFFLIILPADKKLELQVLEEKFGENLRFASEESLKNILGLDKGSVSPFGLINDKNHEVKVLIDRDIWESEFAHFHPNINTETLELSKKDFHKYINSLDNDVEII